MNIKKVFKSKKFFRLDITVITTSNVRAFKEFLRSLAVLPDYRYLEYECHPYFRRSDENVGVRAVYRKILQ
jgi:hypothetical protein